MSIAEPRRTMIKPQSREHTVPDTEAFGVFELVFVCIAFAVGYFKWHHSIGLPHPLVATSLGLLGSLFFFGVAKALRSWTPTRSVGVVLMKRYTETAQNWILYPLRSFSEVFVWLAVIWGTWTLNINTLLVNRVLLSMAMGTLSAMLATLLSEFFVTTVRSCTGKQAVEPVRSNNNFSALIPWMLFLGYVGAYFVQYIFEDDRSFFIAVTVSTLAGACFIFMAELLVQWPPTQRAGEILIQRWKNSPINWINHPIRSLCENSVWGFVIYMTYLNHHFGADNYWIAIRVGTVIGAFFCLFNTWLFPCHHHEGLCVNFNAVCGRSAHSHKKKLDRHIARKNHRKSSTTHKSSMERKLSGKQMYTRAEVSKHDNLNDAWIIINGRVYDVTKWIPRHPGGDVINRFMGADATDQYEAFHQPFTQKMLKHFHVGDCTDAEEENSEWTEDYRALKEYLTKKQMFKPEPSYFVMKSAWLLVIIALLYVVGYHESTYEKLAVYTDNYSIILSGLAGLVMALFWQQAAFLAHDTLHNGVVLPENRGLKNEFNFLGWLFGTCMLGVSAHRWIYEHNVHHAVTLRPREDPQFNYLPVFLQSFKELERFGGTFKLDKITKFLVSVQHYTLLPICIVIGRVNLILINAFYVLKEQVWADIVGIAIHLTYYITAVCMLPYGGWREVLAFLIMSHFAIGTLHIQLLISHLSTEVLTKEEELSMGFFEFQLRTCRNIDTPWYLHWFHGGLEYQIEHHLFPTLPRHNLKKIKPLVESLCEKHSLPYNSMGFRETIGYILNDFESLADALVNVHLD